MLVQACADPLDVVGSGEVVTESQKRELLADDNLADKHPSYDPSRTVVEEFKGCLVTLNKTASVTRLTLQSSGSLDDELHDKLFRSRGAALEALGGAPTLPSIEVVNGALKPFNDGLYAAVELSAEQGKDSAVNKHQLLLDLLAELMTRSSQGAPAEQGPALAAATHIATALALAGETTVIPGSLRATAAQAAADFEEQTIYSKPIGFYTWTPELSQIFTRDRWLQSRYVPGTGVGPFSALAELALVVGQGGSVADHYRRTLDLYAGLTDPFLDRSPFELAAFVPDPSALASLSDVEQRFAASLPKPYPEAFCNPGAAAFPASESAENRMMRKLLCGGELLPDETLLDGLVRKIQIGELDLTPRDGSGFYDRQLYALQTLLVPDQASESQHLLLTKAYKQKLVETFKSLLIQNRETHVKQVGLVNSTSASAEIVPVSFDVYPKLVVEPFPTFYLRTARAYQFLEGVLNAALGPDFLAHTPRLLEDGTSAPIMLGEELKQKQALLFGLHALSADSIGMSPELSADDSAFASLDDARSFARSWLAGVASDADVARDPRVSLPVALESDPDTGQDYAIYWAVVGVQAIHVHASFPDGFRPEIVDVSSGCQHEGWTTFEPYMLVEKTMQVRRPADRAPLTRDEFRTLCDRNRTADAIAEAFASAP